ncbi:uncharacterized protein C16orf52 homolog A-like [Dendronephthya gigantea]|uniref:uncharacterized protein C16orf52 homolog A-like n=1 Tax=Dendronephthya gigantea TaxID=151771 RepID=UPI00106C4F10|nr:uncharacterized protein C16orf52 homolog A-like [Dendronephthya gigantea]
MPFHRVNRFVVVGGLMCAFADLFAIVSLFTPNWVVNDFLGNVKFGLTTLCQESIKGDEVCVTPNLPQSWKVTLVFVILGMLTLTLTSGLTVVSFWKPKAFEYGKWLAVVALMKLCFASIIFPIGFGSPEVGGTPFKLPPNNSLGSSYVCFILSMLFTLFGELCMRKGQGIGFH